MFLWRHVFRKVNVLVAHQYRDKAPSLTLVKGKWDKGRPLVYEVLSDLTLGKVWKRERNVPLVMVITGEGIASRVVATEEDAERIVQREDLLCEKHVLGNGTMELVFTRADRFSSLLELWQKKQLPLVGIRLLKTGGSDVVEEGMGKEIAEKTMESFFKQDWHWSLLMEEALRAKTLSDALVRKWRLPALVVLLILLVGNYLWRQSLETSLAEIQFALKDAERVVSDERRRSQGTEQVVREFEQWERLPWAFMADRMASAVPVDMWLEDCVFSPFLEDLVPGKTVQIDQHTIWVEGRSVGVESLTRFSSALSRLDFTREVTLVDLKRESRSGYFRFRLMMKI